VGGSERKTLKLGEPKIVFPVLKVPRQCPLVLLVEVMHMIGIIFLYESGKGEITLRGLHVKQAVESEV
jgi:hypothetical protein